ncbi:MAG: DUF58 domain-containing protein [Verrucomicrobiota bacterium JB023]|nr:DUF58 domain-containing protein [Verrucomicrobiota bacterium JB023]
MTPEQIKQAHRNAAACSNRLRLPLRSKVWRGSAGEFSGAGAGSSLDFQDHRDYAPGDDPRHINWQAYARTGQYTMKLYREEVRPIIDLIVDVSPSMFVEETKAQRTAELIAFFTESSLRAGASLKIHFVSGSAHREIPADAINSQRWLPIAQEVQAQDPAGELNLSALQLRASAFRVLVSDLLFPGDPNPLLTFLTHRHGTPLLFVPYLQSEADPDWEGNYEFVDPERNSRHPHRIEPRALKAYLEAYRRHFTLWKTSAQRLQILLSRIPADLDLEKALHTEALPIQALEVLS